jgi:hypothetical protein
VLEVSPTELLQLADLWPYRDRPADALDVRMRNAFAHLQMLPFEDKQRAVRVVSCIAEGWNTNHQPMDVAAGE